MATSGTDRRHRDSGRDRTHRGGARTGTSTDTPRDFYQVLGISRDADADAIQRAYRTLARQHHPDVNKDPSAEERFKEISEAYDVLSDPKTRARYDRWGADFRRVPEEYDARPGPGPGADRAGAGGWPGGAWSTTGAPGGFGGYSGQAGFGGFGDDVDLADLLGGGFFRRGQAGPIDGADQEAEIEISVGDAFHGARRTLRFAGPDGPRSLEVTIPPGVTDGQRLRLRGQGGQGRGGGPPGDLYLVIRFAPHPRFRAEGRNLHTDLPLAPWEAALGASVPVPAPAGTATLTVPAGTSSGRTLRLRGQGLPHPGGAPGDLFVHAMIMVPPRLTARERELFDELARVSTFDPRASADTGEGRRAAP
jgi:curved DNA-binding protein